MEACGAVAKGGVCLLRKRKRELKGDFYLRFFITFIYFAKLDHCISFGAYGSQNHVAFPINKCKKLKCIIKFLFYSALHRPVHLLPSSSTTYEAGLQVSYISL